MSYWTIGSMIGGGMAGFAMDESSAFVIGVIGIAVLAFCAGMDGRFS